MANIQGRIGAKRDKEFIEISAIQFDQKRGNRFARGGHKDAPKWKRHFGCR
jgi:hypothetical protein